MKSRARSSSQILGSVGALSAQLLLTELLSISLFGLRLGLIAPIALLLVPGWAIRDESYVVAGKSGAIDIVFLAALIFSIVTDRKVLGGVSLLLFNLICISLILVSW